MRFEEFCQYLNGIANIQQERLVCLTTLSSIDLIIKLLNHMGKLTNYGEISSPAMRIVIYANDVEIAMTDGRYASLSRIRPTYNEVTNVMEMILNEPAEARNYYDDYDDDSDYDEDDYYDEEPEI